MKSEFENRRRALLIFYRRYLAADRAWRLAQAEAVSWFPVQFRPAVPPIGNPGSKLRRLHDQRDRALAKLTVAHLKLGNARKRATSKVRILALPRL